MILRTARLSDIERCGALDASYTAECSWQVSEERPVRPGSPDLTVALRAVRLPRPRQVTPPDPTLELEAEWDATDLFLIAEEEEEIGGYLCVSISRANAWIERLVVSRPYRRQGVATSMLAATTSWAHANGLGSLLAAVPTRNHPAVSLFLARGYSIRGYNERHFSNGDIALYLAQDLRRG